MSFEIENAIWSTVPYRIFASFKMVRGEMILKPSGGGPIAPSRVGPRLLMRAVLKSVWAEFQVKWRSFENFATEIAALVMPIVIGIWTGATGRGATVSVPLGDVDRFIVMASHSSSERMVVRRPVDSTMVALREAKSSTPTLQRK